MKANVNRLYIVSRLKCCSSWIILHNFWLSIPIFWLFGTIIQISHSENLTVMVFSEIWSATSKLRKWIILYRLTNRQGICQNFQTWLIYPRLLNTVPTSSSTYLNPDSRATTYNRWLKLCDFQPLPRTSWDCDHLPSGIWECPSPAHGAPSSMGRWRTLQEWP